MMIWVINNYDPILEEGEIIGEPKPTSWYSLEELKAFGVIGIYKDVESATVYRWTCPTCDATSRYLFDDRTKAERGAKRHKHEANVVEIRVKD